jgi:hypothetical protein
MRVFALQLGLGLDTSGAYIEPLNATIGSNEVQDAYKIKGLRGAKKEPIVRLVYFKDSNLTLTWEFEDVMVRGDDIVFYAEADAAENILEAWSNVPRIRCKKGPCLHETSCYGYGKKLEDRTQQGLQAARRPTEATWWMLKGRQQAVKSTGRALHLVRRD